MSLTRTSSNRFSAVLRVDCRDIIPALVLVWAGYAYLAFYASPAPTKWLFDAIEGISQLAVDDAYRFFESRAAFDHAELWSWAYLLPADALFKGALHALTGSDIYFMRLGHFSINLIAAYFLFHACLLLGVRRLLALGACLALVLMPMYTAISMSFYGESLLTAMSAMAAYAFLAKRYRLFVTFAALMPLAQLQGLFIASGYFLLAMVRRNWRLLAALTLPGFIYFLYVMSVHGSVSTFLSFSQLHKLYPAVPVPIQERGWSGVFVTFNPVLIALAGLGAVLAWRALWPVIFGSFVWMLQVSFIMTYLNGYEPRYVLPALPALFICYAVALDRLITWSASKGLVRGGMLCVFLLWTVLLIENMGQSDPVRANYLGGKRWPVGEPHIGAPYFVQIKSRSDYFGKDLAGRIQGFVSMNPEYRTVIVNQHNIFYYLDRAQMPDGVRVVYTPFSPEVAYPAFGGAFFALSPDSPQADFYSIEEVSVGVDKGIFVGDLSVAGLKPAYENAEYQVHEVSYEHSPPPERIYIVHRMSKELSERGAYKARNLCEDNDNYICPDWRPWRLF